MKHKNVLYFCLLLLVFNFNNVQSQQPFFGLIEKAGDFIPDSIFINSVNSEKVMLNTVINKPTLLVFVYYHCPELCPKMLEGVAELVRYTKANPGIDYQIVTISIDYKETVKQAIQTRDRYLPMTHRELPDNAWQFYTADSLTIRRITNATGWGFKETGDNFVHITSCILISPKGMISQYFYGTYFNYMHFAMSIEKARNEEIVPTRTKVLKYCYNYKPPTNWPIFMVTGIFGILTLLVVLGFFIYMHSTSAKNNTKE